MLRKRLLAGFALGFLTVLMAVVDADLAPHYPALAVATVLAAVVATRELVHLLPIAARPPERLTTVLVLLILASNWGPLAAPGVDPFRAVSLTLLAASLVAFLYELRVYPQDGPSGPRVASAYFCLVYLGFLPSFLVQLRWLDPDPVRSAAMLLVTVTAAKGADIGAYAVGRLIGRTPLSPAISPKKTVEGFVGGLVVAAIAVAACELAYPLFRHGVIEAVLFGVAVGAAGVLGDLAESMIKRDVQAKDASSNIPGFGGILDVFDSLIFAGPVAYIWMGR